MVHNGAKKLIIAYTLCSCLYLYFSTILIGNLKTSGFVTSRPTSSQSVSSNSSSQKSTIGSSYSQNSTTGSSYSRNSTTGKSYSRNSTTGRSYSQNSTTGSSYSRNSTTGKSYSRNSTTGRSYSQNSTTGRSYSHQSGPMTGNSRQLMKISVDIGKKELRVAVSDAEIIGWNRSEAFLLSEAGLYLMVLHERTGLSVKAPERFAIFEGDNSLQLHRELIAIRLGRIIILASVYESFNGLSPGLRRYLVNCGAQLIKNIKVGDRWLMAWSKGGMIWAESMAPCQRKPCIFWQGGKLHSSFYIFPSSNSASLCSEWPSDKAWKMRQLFCDAYDGYGLLCSCDNPFMIQEPPGNPNDFKNLDKAAVTIITSRNRPTTLNRSLMQLYGTPGFKSSSTLITVDDPDSELSSLIDVYQLQSISHNSGLRNTSSRITDHYLFSLSGTFHHFPWADKAIILEDDLLVSPDFFSYFSQLVPIAEGDKTVYCISSWNDFAFPHTGSNPSVVLRTDTMPGLGWLLTKELFRELRVKWPKQNDIMDWDMWFRLDAQRRGRQCLIPEVLRVFHFGRNGAHTDPVIQSNIYDDRNINMKYPVTLLDVNNLYQKNYDLALEQKIMEGEHLNGSQIDPCQHKDFIARKRGFAHVLWFKMNDAEDDYTYEALFNCLEIWSQDVRGGYRSVWQLRFLGTELLVIGWPASPFSNLKPPSIAAIRRSTGLKNETEPDVVIYGKKS